MVIECGLPFYLFSLHMAQSQNSGIADRVSGFTFTDSAHLDRTGRRDAQRQRRSISDDRGIGLRLRLRLRSHVVGKIALARHRPRGSITTSSVVLPPVETQRRMYSKRKCADTTSTVLVPHRNVCGILVREVNAPLPPEAKKILKISLRNSAF